MPNGWFVEFNAQKSAYSDQFYFNYCYYREEREKYLPPYGGHRLTYMDGEGRQSTIFNWQLLSDAAVDALIVNAAVQVLSALEARLTEA